MAKEAIVLAVHGMGSTKPGFAEDLEEKLIKELGLEAWQKVYFDSIYYQPVLEPNQRRVFRAMKRRKMDWIKLREFLLYGFSDAAGLERRAENSGSPYEKVQGIIMSALDKAYLFCEGPLPVIVIAHSLGCQVMSNYIWDAQVRRPKGPKQGVFKGDGPADIERNSNQDKFRRLKKLKYFYTTGCNIPIFVAGFPKEDIRPITTSGKGYAFQWKNYYDEDDALGWPLKPLNKEYNSALTIDKEVNADGGFIGKFTRGWGPQSHGGYWEDKDVIRPLCRDIRACLD